jgi:hypothetical protein
MNTFRITRRVLTVVLVAGALSAPAAAAAPFEERYPSLGDRSDNSIVPPASVEDSSTAPSVASDYSSLNAISGPTADTPAFVSGSPGSGEGFDWGDASIGAAAMLAITAIAVGGAVELSRRRRPRPTVA